MSSSSVGSPAACLGVKLGAAGAFLVCRRGCLLRGHWRLGGGRGRLAVGGPVKIQAHRGHSFLVAGAAERSSSGPSGLSGPSRPSGPSGPSARGRVPASVSVSSSSPDVRGAWRHRGRQGRRRGHRRRRLGRRLGFAGPVRRLEQLAQQRAVRQHGLPEVLGRGGARLLGCLARPPVVLDPVRVVHRQVRKQPLSVGDLIAAVRGDRGDQRVRRLRGPRRGVDELLLERRPLGVVRGAPLGAERPDVQLRDAALPLGELAERLPRADLRREPVVLGTEPLLQGSPAP